MKIKLTGILLFAFFAQQLSAQSIEVSTIMKGIFDNREYNTRYNLEKESFSGTQIHIEIGPETQNEHTFRAGVNYFYEFGSELFENKPNPVIYYSYLNKSFNFKFGAYPRYDLPKFPVAILSESFIYYNPTVDGMLFDQTGKNYRLTLLGDWLSRLNEVRREQFLIGIAASATPGDLLFDLYFYQFHNGRRSIQSTTDYIDDYLGGIAMAGYNFARLIPVFDKAEIKTGIFTSSHRNRLTSQKHTIASSSYSEIKLESHRFGAEVFLKFGGLHELGFGDQFYTNLNNYVRTNLYCIPFKTDKIEARFTWSFHTYKKQLDHQQKFILMWRL